MRTPPCENRRVSLCLACIIVSLLFHCLHCASRLYLCVVSPWNLCPIRLYSRLATDTIMLEHSGSGRDSAHGQHAGRPCPPAELSLSLWAPHQALFPSSPEMQSWHSCRLQLG